jgi:hypothetical protein
MVQKTLTHLGGFVFMSGLCMASLRGACVFYGFFTGFMRVLRFMPGFIWVLCVLCECVYECLCLFYMCLCMCFICAFYVCFIAL